MHIYIPLAHEGHLGVRHRGHIGRRAELGSDRERGTVLGVKCRNAVPPAEVRIQYFFPLGCARVVYLRAFGMAYAAVDVIGTGNSKRYLVGKIRQE